jgi:predicted glutamine amidotransferase
MLTSCLTLLPFKKQKRRSCQACRRRRHPKGLGLTALSGVFIIIFQTKPSIYKNVIKQIEKPKIKNFSNHLERYKTIFKLSKSFF